MAGIKQGCPLSPYLIVLLMDAIFSVGKKEPCQRTKRQPICRSPLWGRSVIVALHESASSRNRWTFKEFFLFELRQVFKYMCIYIYMQPPPLRTYHFVCFRLKRVTRVSYACMQPRYLPFPGCVCFWV